MQDWVVALVAIFAAILCLFVLLLIALFFIRTRQKRPPPSTSTSSPRHSESPAPMPDVFPHIPRPISTISLRSTEQRPSAFDTLTAGKLSQLFESRKSSLPARINYFDFHSSPQLGHKEYLDFSHIQNILISQCERPRKEATTIADTFSPTDSVKRIYSEDTICYNRVAPV